MPASPGSRGYPVLSRPRLQAYAYLSSSSRLGIAPAEKMKFAVDALPHNLGILELIASRWKSAESDAKLGILIIANIEMRERLELPAPAAAPARIP